MLQILSLKKEVARYEEIKTELTATLARQAKNVETSEKKIKELKDIIEVSKYSLRFHATSHYIQL